MDPQKFDYNQDYNYNFGSNYGPGFNPNNNFYNKRSRNMEVAALVLEYQNLTGIDYNELLKQMNTAK